MKKDVWIYAGITAGAIVVIIAIHRYIGRKTIEALKKQEMGSDDKVADVQTNFENNQKSENW